MTDLPAGWTTTTLGDCAIWYSGGTPSTSVKEYWDGDIPWITASSLHDFYVRDSERRVTELGLHNGTRLMPENAIIFVVRGMSLKSEFRVGIARRPVAFGQDCKAIVARKGIDPMFLANALRAKSQSVLRLVSEASHGTGRLETEPLKQLEIALPPLPVQQRIAEILQRLDDKIEVNRRINRTLEAMAQALYKHWFVDFGPFQDGAFVESELGLIPQGWRVERMGDCAEAVKGLSYKGVHLSRAGMPLHNLNSIYEGGGYKYEGIKYYTGEYKPRHLVQPGDVIVANTEQGFDYLLIGCPAIVPKFFGQEGIFSHHLFRVRPREGSFLSPHYLYCLLKDEQFRANVTAFTNGTTVNMLSADGLSNPLMILPSREVSLRFHKIIEPYFQQMEAGHQESQKLTEIRDYLLPKLLSGAIPVEAATEQVDDVTANQPQQLALRM